jgi:single-strand DNA-binding protein
MASINEVFLIGNLGKDPEVRFTGSGQAVCNFTLATNETWNDKDGKKNEKVEWHRVVVWGKAAESCGEYLAKGRQVCVRGRIQTREWEKDGEKKYTTEIVAHAAGGVTFLGNGKGEKNGNASSEEEASFP